MIYITCDINFETLVSRKVQWYA